jgi:hypothetical protein
MHCGDCDTIPFCRWLKENQTFSKSVTCNDYDGKQLSNGCATRLTGQVPLVEQELLTIPEHLRSPPVSTGVRVTRSLVVCVCFVDR